ncbi:helix-turn-helix domain-containing protein [Streptomyces sp. SAJ15]|uniref:helix-turn-helix domain-containing protein n=1 Tax=Streptomyces sp. SAJ15 TaxID=2011095 RepID=UPI00135D4195|nr:helix-turn-helix domain-containing protein [Streptomyces sp. SAJ15]TVL89808.1 hypothetical protein CD790_25780 [Streptomyces sp. SAJ15]
MTAYRLNVAELHRRLNAARSQRGLSWRAVARDAGVGSNAVHRLTKGHAPDAHTLVSLLAWLDLDVAYVTVPATPKAEGSDR